MGITLSEEIAVVEIPHAEDTSYCGHGYFRYIGKFPPQLVSKFLDNFVPGAVIIDPMVGGGTTLVEARLRGLDAFGFDVNPVSALLARTAAGPINPDILQPAVGSFEDGVLSGLSSQSSLFAAKLVPLEVRIRDWSGLENYFPSETLRDLEIVRRAIADIELGDVRDFLTVAVFGVLRRVSFANIKKMNIEIDDNRKKPPCLANALRRQVREMSRRNAEYWQRAKPCSITVAEGSADLVNLPDSSASGVVLHPPYLTNTAFSEATQLQLAYLGVAHKTIWKKELRCRGSFVHEPDGLRKYLINWAKILAEAVRILKPGGRILAVVGDGQIDYVRIPIGAITQEFARDLHLTQVDHYFHKLNNNTGRTQSRRMAGQHVFEFAL